MCSLAFSFLFEHLWDFRHQTVIHQTRLELQWTSLPLVFLVLDPSYHCWTPAAYFYSWFYFQKRCLGFLVKEASLIGSSERRICAWGECFHCLWEASSYTKKKIITLAVFNVCFKSSISGAEQTTALKWFGASQFYMYSTFHIQHSSKCFTWNKSIAKSMRCQKCSHSLPK